MRIKLPRRQKGGTRSEGASGAWGVVAIIQVVVAAIAVGTGTDSDSPEESESVATEPRSTAALEEFELAGEVIIFHPSNFTQEGEGEGAPCRGAGALVDPIPGASVRVTPKELEPIETELGEGEISEEGNCRMWFTPMIPEANSYEFEIGNRESILRDQEPPLFERDGQGGGEGWWISFAWDSNEDPAVTP